MCKTAEDIKYLEKVNNDTKMKWKKCNNKDIILFKKKF